MIRATTLSLFITLLGLGTQLDAGTATSARAAQLYVGSSETNITPDQPVALEGSFRLRISQGVRTPIMASVVIVESREGERVVERSIMVSADLVHLPRTPNYKGPEGPEYQGIPTLFFFDAEGKPLAVAVNVWCPAQEEGGSPQISADFGIRYACG